MTMVITIGAGRIVGGMIHCCMVFGSAECFGIGGRRGVFFGRASGFASIAVSTGFVWLTDTGDVGACWRMFQGTFGGFPAVASFGGGGWRLEWGGFGGVGNGFGR